MAGSSDGSIATMPSLRRGIVTLALVVAGCGGPSGKPTTGPARHVSPEQALTACMKQHHYEVSKFKNPDSVLLRVTSDSLQSAYVWIFGTKELADRYVKPLKLPYTQRGTLVAAYPLHVKPNFKANVARYDSMALRRDSPVLSF